MKLAWREIEGGDRCITHAKSLQCFGMNALRYEPEGLPASHRRVK